MLRNAILYFGVLLASISAVSAAPPAWWAERGATNANPPNDDSVVNQGQLKHFTLKAVEELNARIPGGAGSELDGIIAGWTLEYQNGGHSPTNPLPADFHAMTSGQLKWIAAKIHARLVDCQYESTLPSWLPANPPSTPTPADKQLVNLGQLKTVFNFELTAPTGLLPEWWQKFYFNGQTGIDPYGDADGDGINNVTEFKLGLSPNSVDVVGPVNLGFDKEITDFPTYSFRPTHPSDLYEAGDFSSTSVSGWKAAMGQHIEIWDEGDGNPYAELQSHLGAHGITQEFWMVPGTSVTFILRYKGRYDGWDVTDNAFSLKVEGAEAFELRVNGDVVTSNNSVRSHPFMESDTGNQWASWHSATVTITSLGNGNYLEPITLSLVPNTTTSGGEDITHGGFVDMVPAQFILRDPADYTKGWDDSGTEPWTSVGVGKTNSIVKLIGGGSDYELIVDHGSSSYLSISNVPVTGDNTNFTITGIADSKNLSNGAKIICRKKNTTNAVATIHVHVLPPRIIDLKVYHASDDLPDRVPLSALPANVPAVTTIVTALNDTFKDQANITFIPLSPDPIVINKCYNGFATDGRCYDQPVPGHAKFYTDFVRDYVENDHHLKVIIVKDIVGHSGIATVGFSIRPSDNAFVEATAPLSTYSHEAGHALGLTTVQSSNGTYHEEPGTIDPNGASPLMHQPSGSKWIRQEDWRTANTQAGTNLYGH